MLGIELKNEVDRDGFKSKLFYIYFDKIPVKSKRYYLPQDSELDASRISRVECHYRGTGGDFADTVTNNGVVYNVFTRACIASTLITIKDFKRNLRFADLPLYATYNYLSTGNTGQKVNKSRLEIDTTILTGESWILFPDVSAFKAIVRPILPLTFYYRHE